MDMAVRIFILTVVCIWSIPGKPDLFMHWCLVQTARGYGVN